MPQLLEHCFGESRTGTTFGARSARELPKSMSQVPEEDCEQHFQSLPWLTSKWISEDRALEAQQKLGNNDFQNKLL